ncbi:MAG: hypothetical protein JNM14_05625 [Ferruginibacter sp.]|nr:hypothetical protein [Ferruginibacter sp.]
MKNIFVEEFIPGAKLLRTNSSKGIHVYEINSELFALVNVGEIGCVTETLKQKIMQSVNKPIKCVSLFRKKTDFTAPEDIAWNTYVWFADNPKHYIHFEANAPRIRQIQKI